MSKHVLPASDLDLDLGSEWEEKKKREKERAEEGPIGSTLPLVFRLFILLVFRCVLDTELRCLLACIPPLYTCICYDMRHSGSDGGERERLVGMLCRDGGPHLKEEGAERKERKGKALILICCLFYRFFSFVCWTSFLFFTWAAKV